MPTLKEVIEKENEQRLTSEEVRTVRLSRMGNFIRAYDWSAWLLKHNGSPLNVGLDTTSGTHHVFVGFPLASIDKFQPEGSEARKDGDGVPKEWILAQESFPPEEAFDTLEKTYSNWLDENIQRLLAEQAQKKERRREKEDSGSNANSRQTRRDELREGSSAQPLRLMDIAREILRFRTEEHSPVECAVFIRSIQSDILSLI